MKMKNRIKVNGVLYEAVGDDDVRTGLTKLLKDLDADDLIVAYNNYCDNSNDSDSHIFQMDELNDVLEDKDPMEIVNMCFNGDHFNPNEDWFWFDGYANLESAGNVPGLPIEIDDMVDFMIDDDDDLEVEGAREILDEG